MNIKRIGIGAAIAGAVLATAGLLVSRRESASIAIIGGADGPTSIFVVGESLGFAAMAGVLLGLAVVMAALVLILKKRK